jgi:hypothetical protein
MGSKASARSEASPFTAYNRAMGWLQNLLSRGRNPEEYERLRCPVCDGTGLPAFGGHSHSSNSMAPPHCARCGGKGWLMVKRQPEEDELHDSLESRPSFAVDGQPASAGAVDETLTVDAGGSPGLPDVPDAPTSPTAPKGLDEA